MNPVPVPAPVHVEREEAARRFSVAKCEGETALTLMLFCSSSASEPRASTGRGVASTAGFAGGLTAVFHGSNQSKAAITRIRKMNHEPAAPESAFRMMITVGYAAMRDDTPYRFSPRE
jgi:hypothetical protein